jgi:hypothetical protein
VEYGVRSNTPFHRLFITIGASKREKTPPIMDIMGLRLKTTALVTMMVMKPITEWKIFIDIK